MFGCSDPEPTHKVLFKPKPKPEPKQKVSPVIGGSLLIMDEKKKKELIEQSYKKYKIKYGDRIIVNVTGHPGLSTSKSPSLVSKTVVSRNGTIQLPTIGIVKAVGLNSTELKDVIIKKLKKVLLHPDVTVSVVFVRKNRYTLIGEFVHTNAVIEKEYPMNLLEVIALGDGIKKDTADLRHAYVVRDNKKLPVNLFRLLNNGDLSQNIDMIDRDVVVVPNYKSDRYVYVYTKMSRASKARVPLYKGKLTLLQALSMSGLIETREEGLDIKNIYILRTEMDRVETFKVDAEKMFKGYTLPFELAGGDIVFIPKTKVADINTIVAHFFPIMQLINNTLNNIDMFYVDKNHGAW
jgi:polysaccharide export outer membrane protein